MSHIRVSGVSAVVLSAIVSSLLAAEPGVASLVRARVTAVGEVTKNSSVATLEVTHVYSGDPKLLGRTFRDTQMFQHSAGHPAHA